MKKACLFAMYLLSLKMGEGGEKRKTPGRPFLDLTGQADSLEEAIIDLTQCQHWTPPGNAATIESVFVFAAAGSNSYSYSILHHYSF